MALAVKLGRRPLQARCHVGLAKLFTTRRNTAKAREHLDLATAIMRELDMGFWLEQADGAALAQL